jgi:prepilin-type N-terminal cleavage/methylation domain-containing protein
MKRLPGNKPHCSGFTIIEIMIAITVLVAGLTGILGLMQSQSVSRKSTKESKSYLAVARALRERLESIPLAELGASSTAATAVNWTVQRPLEVSGAMPWTDGVLTDADGGLDEDDLVRVGIIDQPMGDALRVFIEYKRAYSTPTRQGALDMGWQGNGEVRIPDQPTDLNARWTVADAANTASGIPEDAPARAIRISMVWKESGTPSMIGTIPEPGFRLHQIIFLREEGP